MIDIVPGLSMLIPDVPLASVISRVRSFIAYSLRVLTVNVWFDSLTVTWMGMLEFDPELWDHSATRHVVLSPRRFDVKVHSISICAGNVDTVEDGRAPWGDDAGAAGIPDRSTRRPSEMKIKRRMRFRLLILCVIDY